MADIWIVQGTDIRYPVTYIDRIFFHKADAEKHRDMCNALEGFYTYAIVPRVVFDTFA